MKRFVLLFLLFLAALTSYAQPNRYKEAVFTSINRQDNIVYANADRYDLLGQNNPEPLRFDFFEPAGDTAALRPLVLTFFGGFFLAGNKNWADMEAWCDSLSRYGYAAATVEYRLGYDPTSRSLLRAGYRAVQDARAAIRYFKANATQYRIDTTQIFLVGNSAGAITALQAPFADDSDRPAASFAGSPLDIPNNSDLGCMDCVGGHQNHTAKNVRGVIALWGGTPYPSGLDSSDNSSVLMIHGELDTSVPIDSGNILSNSIFPVIYGSRTLDSLLTGLGKDSRLVVYPNEGHNFYLEGPLIDQLNFHWDSIWGQAHPFLCELNPYCDLATSRVEEVTIPWEISVFPNPAHTFLQLQFSNSGPKQLTLIDLNGQVLLDRQTTIKAPEINIEGFPAGMYLLKVREADRIFLKKILIQ